MSDNNGSHRKVLPNNWAITTLHSIAELVFGQSPPSETYNEEQKGLPFFQGKAEFGEVYPTPKKWCSVPKKVAEKGDVLISVRAPVGPTNIAPEKCCIGRGLAAARGLGGIHTEFVLYLLRAHEDYFSGKKTGSTFEAITGSVLREFIVPLPPLPEQHRIVAKIEELFTKLDAGVENLKKTKVLLKRYRQAVLKAAVEGRLTEAWREKHKDELEPASVLLERILKERREKWTGRGKYKEPAEPDIAKLPPIPEGWTWATLEEIGQKGRPIIYGIIKPGPHIPDGVPYVRVTEMKDGRIDVPSLKRASRERASKFARATLAPGDVLISKDGTIGRVAIVPPELAGGNITQHVMRAPINAIMSLYYVAWAIRSDWCQHWLTGETRGVALRGVNVEDFRRLPIPIPPLAEQQRIVEEVERRLSVVDELEKTIGENLKRADRLRQSILKKAFSGKLVPQDPSDEPASVLLERIKAEKVKPAKTRRSSAPKGEQMRLV